VVLGGGGVSIKVAVVVEGGWGCWTLGKAGIFLWCRVVDDVCGGGDRDGDELV